MYGNIHRHDAGAQTVAPGAGKMHHTATVLQVIAHMCNRFLHLLAVKHTLFYKGRAIYSKTFAMQVLFSAVLFTWSRKSLPMNIVYGNTI